MTTRPDTMAVGRSQAVRTSGLRIMHVDDKADIRELVEQALALDPGFAVRSCASGEEALAVAVDWRPQLILCDVAMPAMDGPELLGRLRQNSNTAHIPVVFMTGYVQAAKLEHFKALGATGIIAKPFDPITLANSVRTHLRGAGIAALRAGFVTRMRSDAAVLAKCRTELADDATSPETLGQIKSFAHALAGAAGIFGFHEVTVAAAGLERATAEKLRGAHAPMQLEPALDALLVLLQQAPA